MNTERSGRPLDSGSLQLARNDEEHSQKRTDRGPWRLRRRQNWQLGSSNRETKSISDAQLALIVHRWEKPLEKEKPRALDRMGSWETMGKTLRQKVGLALQNWRYIGGILGW